VETVIVPNIDVVKRGISIGFAPKLGSGSGEISTRRNLSRNSTLLTSSTKVVCIPQMVLTNLITTIHGNMTFDRSLMNSMVVGRYKSANAMHPKRGYQKPFAIITTILDHRRWPLC